MPKDQINQKDDFFLQLKPHLHRAIGAIRLERKWTVAALAKKTEINAKTLARLEEVDAPLRTEYVTRICAALEVELDDLLRKAADLAEEERSREEASSDPIEAELDRLLKQYAAHVHTGQSCVDTAIHIARMFREERKGLRKA